MPNCKIKIMYKRKRGKKGEPTPDLHPLKTAANKAYSKTRSRVEHAFATIKEVFGFKRLRYRGLERVSAKFDSLAIAYNLRRLGFLVREPIGAQRRCA